jgi:hypothetical protein
MLNVLGQIAIYIGRKKLLACCMMERIIHAHERDGAVRNHNWRIRKLPTDLILNHQP